MAVWRRRALEAFPELRNELNDKREIWSIYALWSELLPMTLDVNESADEDLLGRIYDFALWCYRQESKELWNSAAVAFYEHVLDVPEDLLPDVLGRLPDDVIADVWGLWEHFEPENKIERVRVIPREHGRPVPTSGATGPPVSPRRPRRISKGRPERPDRRRRRAGR